MKISRIAIVAATLALGVTPVLADEESEQRKIVGMVIGMQGFTCGYAAEVVLLEDGSTFEVTCTANEDGSGDETLYMVTLTGTVELIE